MRHFRHARNSDDEINEAEQRMQKNTFSQWVNHHLQAHSSSGQLADLFEDMRDGVLLCHLLEVLTGDVLPVTTVTSGSGNGKNSANNGSCANHAKIPRVYQLNNLSTALKCLRAKGMELVNNNVTDLADGNPRIWLGLIWQMILHFQVETGLSLVRQSAWHQLHSERQQQQQEEEEKEEEMMMATTGEGVGPSTSTASGRAIWRVSPQHQKGRWHGETMAAATTRSLPTTPLRRETPEQALLKWLNQEVIRPSELGCFPWSAVPDLDRSWRDGRLLLALVHRFAPALVAPEALSAGGDGPEAALERAQRAIQLARLHLGIRPLLDPVDLCCAPAGRIPCRRSLVTYISQFLRLSRPPLLHPAQLIQPAAVVMPCQVPMPADKLPADIEPFRHWLDWLQKVAREGALRLEERQRVTLRQFRWYRRIVRKEWLERRHILVEKVLPGLEKSGAAEARERVMEELNLVESSIATWEANLHSLLAETSEELVAIDQWLTGAEKLLAETLPVEGDAAKIDETLDRLEEAIGKLEDYFTGGLPLHRARIFHWLDQLHPTAAFHHDDDALLLQSVHLVEDMAERCERIAGRQRRALRQLLFQQAHFRLLEYLSRLKCRLRVWAEQTGNLSTTTEAMEEYKEMAAEEKPVHRMEKLMDSLKESAALNLRSDGERGEEAEDAIESASNQSILAQFSLESQLELRRFVRVEFILADLVQLWREFDAEEAKMMATGDAGKTWRSTLERMEELAEEMDEAGGQWTSAAGEAARQRIQQQNKLLARHKEEEEDEEMGRQLLLSTEERASHGGERWREWMDICGQLGRIRPRNGEECAALMESLNDLRRDLPLIEDDFGHFLMANPEMGTISERDELGAQFGQAKRQLAGQLTALAQLSARLGYLEGQLTELDQWTRHHDPDCRLAGLSIVQRAGLVDWARQELADLADADSAGPFPNRLDFSQLDAMLKSILRRFKVEQGEEDGEENRLKAELVEQSAHLEEKLRELERLEEGGGGGGGMEKGREEEMTGDRMERIHSLRSRLVKAGQEWEQTGPSSTQKVDLWALLKRQRGVLAREEGSEEEMRASLREMALIQQELGSELKGNAEFEKQADDVARKKALLERLLRMNGEMKQILGAMERRRGSGVGEEEEVRIWPELEARLRRLAEELAQVPERERLPMDWHLGQRVQIGEQQLRRQWSERRRHHREALRAKMDALRLTPEADLHLALDIVEEVVREAAQILQQSASGDGKTTSPTPHQNKREEQRLADESESLKRSLHAKMALLQQLRELADTVQAVHHENAQWTRAAIQSAQIEPILERLADALRLLNGPLPEKCAELENELGRQRGTTFMKGEWEGARQSLRGNQAQIGALREQIEQKQVFLLKWCAFKSLVEKCRQLIDRIGHIGSAIEGQKLQQELAQLRARILDSASEVVEAQARAGMELADGQVEKVVEELVKAMDTVVVVGMAASTTQQAPPAAMFSMEDEPQQSSASVHLSIGDRLEQFLSQSAQLESQFRLPLPKFNAHGLSPAMFLDQITHSVHSERESLRQIEQVAAGLSLPQPNTLADTIRLLQSHLDHREREMLERIREMLGRCMKAYVDTLGQMEAEMASAMERRDTGMVANQREAQLPEHHFTTGMAIFPHRRPPASGHSRAKPMAEGMEQAAGQAGRGHWPIWHKT